jgi:electron transfer flavoprotein beta subunit
MAKRKKVEVLTPADIGIDPENRAVTAGIEAPPSRAAGQIVESPEALVEKLFTEAKVL